MSSDITKKGKDIVVKSSLKLKKGNIFKNKSAKRNVDVSDISQIDLTIQKEEAGPKKTAAELAFEKRQQETAYERLAKKAAVSHREKVEKFNKQMEELTEFNDIPKVSWTK
uniref:Protein FAM32A n=1 Tax=Ditylenchus dipsaci TaxID=166011 RepID=A0A915DRV8_9BILA